MKGSKTMSTSEPRVPLAATINLPGSQRSIQVNHCKMPDCSNFGVPARTEKGKPGPSADRDMKYKVHSTAKGTIPAVRCKACLDLPPIKSNASIRVEVERLAEASGIWTLEESTECSNNGCGNHHRPIAFHPEEYRKRGKGTVHPFVVHARQTAVIMEGFCPVSSRTMKLRSAETRHAQDAVS